MSGPVMTPELRAWKLTPRLAGALGLAELDNMGLAAVALVHAAIPYATLGALRRRGLIAPGIKRDGRTVSFLTFEGEKARAHLERIEAAWPGTLQRWKESRR